MVDIGVKLHYSFRVRWAGWAGFPRASNLDTDFRCTWQVVQCLPINLFFSDALGQSSTMIDVSARCISKNALKSESEFLLRIADFQFLAPSLSIHLNWT